MNKIFHMLDVETGDSGWIYKTSRQSKIEAEQLLLQMQTKKFVFMLVTFCELFKNSDFATERLQAQRCV